MTDISRREVLKAGLGAAAGVALGAKIVHATPRHEGTVPIRPEPALRERLLMDPGWRFHLGHASDPAQDFGFGKESAFAKTGTLFEPSKPDFDVSGWRDVDLPHDWAVELPFVDDPDVNDFGYKPVGRGHPATSIGWYRKVFTLPASDSGRRLALVFDGVFRDAMFALNGIFLGRNQSGYAPVRYDITDVARYGEANVLVVRCDATLHEGWFYEGAGIYRHVWLEKTQPVHVAADGTYVTSRVRQGGGVADVDVVTEVTNDTAAASPVIVDSVIKDATGLTVATARSESVHVPPGETSQVRQRLVVNKPELWSVDHPKLYTMTTTVVANGALSDRCETSFGIRTFTWDPDRGFFVNGQRVELKGTCNHQDHAGVGSALPDRLQYYRVQRLKDFGCNAYRTSHNPPTPELLDACDRLGLLVLDETRMFSSEPEGLSELERLVRRDRNRACVFAWSIANEEWAVQARDTGTRIATSMKHLVRQLDPSRPVTAAMDGSFGKGTSLALDVQGYNYHLGKPTDDFHAQFPKKPSFGTEVGSTVSTRGIYANDKVRGYVSAYDVNFPPWASTAEAWWSFYDARPWSGGGFVWTGFDYRGEPTPYKWPCINSHFGILDTCGFAKDNFYYYKAWWGAEPVLHLFPHWNWAGREGQEIEVWCHSNLERVELFLNGKSLGSREMKKDSHVQWMVRYEPGTLEARGYRGNTQVLTDRRITTGAPARVVLRPDSPRLAANGEDVAVIVVEIVDGEGRVVPVADDLVSFEVSGPGKLIGVGNGDPSSHEPDKAAQRHAFNGLCSAIVQSARTPGEIRVRATAPGLTPATLAITSTTAPLRPTI